MCLMATAKSDAKLREVYMKKDKADLINIALDQADTIKQLRGINAELSARLRKEQSKIQELEGEITWLKTFSEATAQAVLQLTNQPRSRSNVELDRELERELRETQRMGSMQRRFAEQELARREAGQNHVITHFESQAPDAPTPVSASDVMGERMRVEEERNTVYPYQSGKELAHVEMDHQASERIAHYDKDLRRDNGMW